METVVAVVAKVVISMETVVAVVAKVVISMVAKVVISMVAEVTVEVVLTVETVVSMEVVVVIVWHWVRQVVNTEWRVYSLKWSIMVVKVVTREVMESMEVSMVSMVAERLVVQVSVVGFTVVSVPEWLVVDHMGIVWSKAVVGCPVVQRWISNVWVVRTAMVRA